MTNKELLGLALALQALMNFSNPRKSRKAVKELWGRLPAQHREWLLPRLDVPDRTLKLMNALKGSTRPVFRGVFEKLSAADQSNLLRRHGRDRSGVIGHLAKFATSRDRPDHAGEHDRKRPVPSDALVD